MAAPSSVSEAMVVELCTNLLVIADGLLGWETLILTGGGYRLRSYREPLKSRVQNEDHFYFRWIWTKKECERREKACFGKMFPSP